MSELKPQGLKKSQILLYGFFGMFLNTFYLMFLAYNRLFYLTNVLQLSTQISAVVNTLSVWGNVVTMLLAGAIIEKFTFKSGKFRTWTIIGGIVRGDKVFIAVDNMEIIPYDRVVVFAMPGSVGKVGYYFN